MPENIPTSLRNRILESRLGRHTVREWVFPVFVKLYPLLFLMRSFDFGGKRYRYKFHPHGATIRGERIVEIPIALEEMKRQEGKRILEVGNVLSHYLPCRHDVVDKYEQAPGCMNYDILDFQPSAPYEFIISISTVEHIGWNDTEDEPERAVQALAYMKSLLVLGGRMLVTMPWGGNPALDRHLQSETCIFDQLYYMERTSRRNTWRQIQAPDLARARYGHPYPFANILVVGYLTRS